MPTSRFAKRVRVVSIILCLGMAGPAGLAGAARGTVPLKGTVPFRLDQSGLVVVPVSFGGLEPRPCLLDTGSTRTIITDRLQASLGLAAMAKAPVVSSAGTVTHEVVELPPVTIGEVTQAGLYATVLPASQMRAITAAASCVVGQDFLSARDYTLDYRAKKLSWDGGAESEDSQSTRIPLIVDEGRYVIELRQPAPAESSVRLVPDSGASDIVLFRQPEAPPLRMAPLLADRTGQLVASTGQREVSAVRLERLRIGTIDITNQRAYLVDRAWDERTGAQGLLPLRLFARVSFRSAERVMMVAAR